VAKQQKAASRPASSISAVDVTKVLTTLDRLAAIRTIDDFNAQRANLVQAIADLKTHLTAQDAQLNSLSQTITTIQAELLNLQTANGALQQQVKTQQATIDTLNARLAAVSAAPPPTKPGDLADSFRKVVDEIQSQARLHATRGPATTIRNMDI
jgi:chromosome segregation ATPase